MNLILFKVGVIVIFAYMYQQGSKLRFAVAYVYCFVFIFARVQTPETKDMHAAEKDTFPERYASYAADDQA